MVWYMHNDVVLYEKQIKRKQYVYFVYYININKLLPKKYCKHGIKMLKAEL